MQPDLGVHGEGKVDRRGALGQPDHVAVRSEDEDLLGIEIKLQELEKLVRCLCVELQLQDLTEPAELVVQIVPLGLPFLVDPVRGDAVFGGAVHLSRANLDLEQLLARAENGGVQGLVAVGFGLRDVILDPLLDRRPPVVDHA